MDGIKELHTVALLKDIPSKSLQRGDVGTVVGVLSDTAVEVEFIDKHGRTISIGPIHKTDLIRLRMDVVHA